MNSNGIIILRKAAIRSVLVLCVCLLAVSCKTAGISGSHNTEYAVKALTPPAVTDISGTLSVSVGSIGPLSVKTRLCWNQSISMSYSVLGLLEVAGVEMTPDKITVVNRVNRVYCEMGYSDIPYTDLLKLDFQVVQGLLWGKTFVYGMPESEKAISHLGVKNPDETGSVAMTDSRGGFQFVSDSSGRVSEISKSSIAYNFSAHYSGTANVGQLPVLPGTLEVRLSSGKKDIQARVRYSGFASPGVIPGSGASVAGMRKVSVEEMVNILKKYL